MPNNKCHKCGKTVYAAEEKRFEHPKEGVMFFHGLCFGAYKKDMDQANMDLRNREYDHTFIIIQYMNTPLHKYFISKYMKKNKEIQDKHNHFVHDLIVVCRYNKKPDVAPEYYRVSDPSTGEAARMESSQRDK